MCFCVCKKRMWSEVRRKRERERFYRFLPLSRPVASLSLARHPSIKEGLLAPIASAACAASSPRAHAAPFQCLKKRDVSRDAILSSPFLSLLSFFPFSPSLQSNLDKRTCIQLCVLCSRRIIVGAAAGGERVALFRRLQFVSSLHPLCDADGRDFL